MSQQQPRICLRPPPHRDYLHGYPGIPAFDPARDDTTPAIQDPVLPLPYLLRPQAHLSGTVEIRSPSKGPLLRAKWLSLELEKIETIPPRQQQQQQRNSNNNKDKHDGRFVELIGTGPSRLWIAGQDPGAAPDRDDVDNKRRGGFKGISFKKQQHEDEPDDGYDLIPDGNYPFKIALPEGLPPTTEIDFNSSGISYQLVASLCVKGKKTLLKGGSKPTVLVASASIMLHKADILPAFPAYAPILSPPIPQDLPWLGSASGWTVGESRETELTFPTTSRGGGGSRGKVTLRAIRRGSAFGPGDEVQLFIEIVSTCQTPIRLVRLEFVLREQITFRYPSPNNSSYLVRSPPRTNSIVTSDANIPTRNGGVVLHRDEPVTFSLEGTVPTSHARVTVKTAKHIDVAYDLQIRAKFRNNNNEDDEEDEEEEIVIDQWPVVVGNVNTRVARGIVHDIGYVPGLCDRPNVLEEDESTNVAPRPLVSSPVRHESPATAAAYSDMSPPIVVEHRALTTPEQQQRQHGTNRAVVARPEFTPSPTAEEEKRRYYEAATKSRDTLQRGLERHHNHQIVHSPIDTTSTSLSHEETPLSPFTYHEVSKREVGLPPPVRRRSGEDRDDRLFEDGVAGISRSNTTFAASGSAVSSATSVVVPPPPSSAARSGPLAPIGGGSTLLGRSLTSAESEKKRLFLEAKEMARARQEEARLALERQNRVLEEFEFEEAQRDFEERLILEAEDDRRRGEQVERDEFERKLERERVEKLERFEREQMEAREKRQLEVDRWARERKEEDEMKKRKAEELRRLDDERERQEGERREAVARKAEMERQRAEDEQRRLEGERLRRAEQQQQQDDEERRQREYERQVREQDHRRRIERERRDEDENRRLYLEQAARTRAQDDAYVASHPSQAYPSSSHGRAAAAAVAPSNAPHASTSPHRIAASAIERAPSVASFAPSTSAANADSHFYAQQIASGHQSALSEEKAQYLRQLRQSQHHHHHQASSGPHYSTEPAYPTQTQTSGGIRHETLREYASPPPPRDEAPRSRSTTPTPNAPRASTTTTNANGHYKSAAEEKAELTAAAAAARRRAEQEQARIAPPSSYSPALPTRSTTAFTSTTNGNGIGNGFDEDGDLAPPPSYPVPSSSASTAAARSAAEEKDELSAYYRAKEAVEVNGRALQQQQYPLTRQPSAPLALSPSTPAVNGYDDDPSRLRSAPTHPHVSPASSDSSSHPVLRPRDPQVSLGKQRAASSSTTSTRSFAPKAEAPPSSSIVGNYSSSPHSPSAPPPPPPLSFLHTTTTANVASRNGHDDYSRNGVRVPSEFGTGIVEGFGSFHLETEFPEFDRIAERIQRGDTIDDDERRH